MQRFLPAAPDGGEMVEAEKTESECSSPEIAITTTALNMFENSMGFNDEYQEDSVKFSLIPFEPTTIEEYDFLVDFTTYRIIERSSCLCEEEFSEF